MSTNGAGTRSRDDTAAARPRRGRLRLKSIRTKLIVWFGLVFIAVLAATELVRVVGVPFTRHSGRLREERSKAFRSLNLVADLKKDRLLRWLDERRGDAHLFAQNDAVRSDVMQLRTVLSRLLAQGRKAEDMRPGLQAEESNRSLRKFMQLAQASYKIYERILIADAGTGIVLASTDEEGLGSNVSEQRAFAMSLEYPADHIADPVMDTLGGGSVLRVSHVITSTGDASSDVGADQAVAVLIAEIRADEIIRPMLHTGEGLGVRGEALLVNRDVKILTSLKHPLPNGAAAIPLEYQIQAEPAVLAAGGREGIIEAKDYRGEPVLAAYRHIRLGPDTGWGLVVKQDKEELFAPMRRQTVYALSVGAIGVLVVLILTVVVASSLTRPILSLSRATAKVAQGDLDARAEVSSSDEAGRLAATFNEMTERVQRRTVQLRQLASELISAEQRERRRLAQVLHDHLQQLLVTARMQIEAQRNRVHDEDVAAVLEETYELLGKSLDASRSLTVELSPPILYDAGLPAALEWLGRQMQARHGLTVEVEIDSAVKPDIEGVGELLFQAVRELLFNIVKHSGVLSASVSLARLNGDGNWVQVVVTDRGKGFDSSQLFAASDRSSGFGLFSIRERLELLAGRMEVRSSPGHGTCVRLVAPLDSQAMSGRAPSSAIGQETALPLDAASQPVSTPKSPGRKIRVLLADDHRTVRKGLVSLLHSEPDIEVVAEAEDGLMAVELARRVRPDVVIMDVTMPRLNGMAATRCILAETPGIRVIGLSMHEDQDMAARMHDAGAVAYLTKGGPLDPLVSAVRGDCAGPSKQGT